MLHHCRCFPIFFCSSSSDRTLSLRYLKYQVSINKNTQQINDSYQDNRTSPSPCLNVATDMIVLVWTSPWKIAPSVARKNSTTFARVSTSRSTSQMPILVWPNCVLHAWTKKPKNSRQPRQFPPNKQQEAKRPKHQTGQHHRRRVPQRLRAVKSRAGYHHPQQPETRRRNHKIQDDAKKEQEWKFVGKISTTFLVMTTNAIA